MSAATLSDDIAIFAVLDIGTTVDDEGRHWPTAVIDATGHPEVTDLARVHAVDGIGDIATEAAVVDGVLILAVMITVPVRATFALAFVLDDHRPVLDDAMDAGHLVIATTEPAVALTDQPLWLAIDLDPALLRDVLPS